MDNDPPKEVLLAVYQEAQAIRTSRISCNSEGVRAGLDRMDAILRNYEKSLE
jgi:hypothetical protein